MVNINIPIPDDVHKEIRVLAAIEDKTIKELITEVLADSIENG